MRSIHPGLVLAAVLMGSAFGAGDSKLIPLTSGGSYVRDGKKYELGLYPGGKNEIPDAHRKAGERIAATIAPLNAEGKPDKNGNILAMAVGHSNPSYYFVTFTAKVKDGLKTGELHPKLVTGSVCYSGRMCPDWAEMCENGDPKLPKNTQVVFLLTSIHGANRDITNQRWPELSKMSFEQRTAAMKKDLKRIVHGLLKHCPELKMVYLGSDTWRGYTQLEPQVYEEAFAIKELIADQIKGDKDLAFEGPNRKAPWLACGGYIWENEPPRERFIKDGVHPTPEGNEFAAGRWFEALKSNPTCRGWFWVK